MKQPAAGECAAEVLETYSANSGLDLLVDFEVGPTFDSFLGLRFLLEDQLGQRLDLVTPHALTPRLRPVVKPEAVDVV
ncbi:MAG: hypothetical protein WCG85_06180 [Polyangia bacterium]